MNALLRNELLAAPPAFHAWDGSPRVGGFDPAMLECLERTIVAAAAAGGVAYETGAGLSSVWLLSLGMREVHSFCKSQTVCTRIGEYLQDYPDEHARWHCHVGLSELTLPAVAIAAASEPADFCLIDGGHGLVTVFNDFLFLNYLLKPRGLLAIDDLQIGSCRLLYELLIQPGMGFAECGRSGKLVMLRKETDRRLLGDFGGQQDLLVRLSDMLNERP